MYTPLSAPPSLLYTVCIHPSQGLSPKHFGSGHVLWVKGQRIRGAEITACITTFLLFEFTQLKTAEWG